MSLCGSVREAESNLEEIEFDALVLDVMMPEKDGFMVAKKIRSVSDVFPAPILPATAICFGFFAFAIL